MKDFPIKQRSIVVSIIRNEAGKLLLCKVPCNTGTYSGQWALPGGGIKPGEDMISALRRKVKEEVGIDITNIEPRSFSEGFGVKKMPDGNDMPVHMIFLYFDCISHSEQIILHNGFEDFAWVMEHELSQYNLNPPTKSLFKQRGFL